MTLHKAVATVFGLGYAPKAPGTFGTLGAFLFCLFANYLFPVNYISIVFLIGAFAGIFGIYSTNKVIPIWGDDPSRVVVDEFVGYIITLTFIPFTLTNLLLAFILFRFFDILKPLGVKAIDEKIKGGLGVMLDDVLAGIYACLSLHLILFLQSLI